MPYALQRRVNWAVDYECRVPAVCMQKISANAAAPAVQQLEDECRLAPSGGRGEATHGGARHAPRQLLSTTAGTVVQIFLEIPGCMGEGGAA